MVVVDLNRDPSVPLVVTARGADADAKYAIGGRHDLPMNLVGAMPPLLHAAPRNQEEEAAPRRRWASAAPLVDIFYLLSLSIGRFV